MVDLVAGPDAIAVTLLRSPAGAMALAAFDENSLRV
jgi:hypothetical protein